MSGYYFATGSCIRCGRLFTFNPELVPSSSAVTGTREPICAVCIDVINAQKRELGLPEWIPPPGAYDGGMQREDMKIGRRVRIRTEFVGVPLGTEGVIDEQYQIHGCVGWMIAWDLPHGRLPPGYDTWDGRPLSATGILRDGFTPDELQYLEAVDA